MTTLHPAARFFLYLLVCLMLAATLTPALMSTGWIAIEPHRVMGRLAQLLILVGLWPFLRWQGLAQREALGYGPSWPVLRRAVIGGWVLGVLILVALVLALLELEIRLPDPSPDSWSRTALRGVQALIGGLLIGVLEETFFRGALYSAIRFYPGTFTQTPPESTLRMRPRPSDPVDHRYASRPLALICDRALPPGAFVPTSA